MISYAKLFMLGTLVIPLNKNIEVVPTPPPQPILRQYKVSFYRDGQVAKNGYLFTETPQLKFFLNTKWFGFIDRKTGEYVDVYQTEASYSMRVQMQNPVVTGVTPVYPATGS